MYDTGGMDILKLVKVKKTSFIGCIKNGMWAIFHVFLIRNFFFKNDPIKNNFMRGIDCAHSRSLKTLPWFRKSVYWSKNMKILNFPSENHRSWGDFMWGIRKTCSRVKKCFPEWRGDTRGGRCFSNSLHKITPGTMIFRRKIQNFHIFASIHFYFPESGFFLIFQASGMF